MREDIKQAIECWASRPTWFRLPSQRRQGTQAGGVKAQEADTPPHKRRTASGNLSASERLAGIDGHAWRYREGRRRIRREDGRQAVVSRDAPINPVHGWVNLSTNRTARASDPAQCVRLPQGPSWDSCPPAKSPSALLAARLGLGLLLASLFG